MKSGFGFAVLAMSAWRALPIVNKVTLYRSFDDWGQATEGVGDYNIEIKDNKAVIKSARSR